MKDGSSITDYHILTESHFLPAMLNQEKCRNEHYSAKHVEI